MPAYRDINPAPINLAAQANDNVLTGATVGRMAAENALTMRKVAHDDATRMALGNYLSSPPEERDARLNALVGADPAMASNVLTIEHARADRAAAADRAEAQATIGELQAIAKSSNPGLAYTLMAGRPDENNALRGLTEALVQMGVVNLEDGISDDEARTIAEQAIVQLTPIAGAQDVERADPADVRAMELLGFPLTKEGFAEYNAAKGGGGATVADQLAVIQANLAMEQRRDQIERDRKADELATETRRKERVALRTNIRNSITQTKDIVDLATKVQGSVVQAGIPFADARAATLSTIAGLGSAFGFDTSKQQDLVDAFNKLKKDTNDQLISLMSSGDLGQGTNSKLQQYKDSLASPNTSLGAIMSIQARIAQDMLDAADLNDFEVFDRDKVEANIEKWRSYEAPAGETVVDVPGAVETLGDFAKATLEQIQSIDVDALTAPQRAALVKRLDELGL